jgi:arylsulfatase B
MLNRVVTLLLLGSLQLLAQPSRSQPEIPNIVVIVADDLGWRDVGYHGGEVKTPSIDRIATEGVRLERFYVAPVCSPTRAGLMTGRYPIRYGSMRAVYPPWRKGGLDPNEVTIADALADAGYEHRGVFGKWHLGHSSIQYHPLRRGFTEFIGHYNGAIDYFTHEREGEVDWHRDYEPLREKGYSTDLIAGYAARFIESRGSEPSPFLCYVAFNAVHSPFQAKDGDLALYLGIDAVPGDWPASVANRRDKRRALGGMIAGLDRGVGRILEAIDEGGLREKTLVWFLSDNGGVGGIGDNRPLKGAKASVFEGGIRVPSAVRWPGKIRPGTTVTSVLAYIDIMPTLMAVAGLRDHGGKPLDGISAVGRLTNRSTATPEPNARATYSYIGQLGPDREQISCMTTLWKLVVIGPVVTDPDADDSKRQKLLYFIREDPNERNNVAAEHPGVVEELYGKIKAFRALQPKDAVPPYSEGREGFKAPKEWRIPNSQSSAH